MSGLRDASEGRSPEDGGPPEGSGTPQDRSSAGGRSAKGGESPEIARLAELVRDARSVVALTGAGISVPSGIPDFRSPTTGTWQKVDPMKVAHIDSFRADPVRFWHFYGERFATIGGKRPNDAHRALVAMERRQMLDGVITQNIDMLHRKAGTSELIEVHGSIARCSCPAAAGASLSGGARAPDGRPGRDSPLRILRRAAASRGRAVRRAALRTGDGPRARACASADLLLCIGSSLEVQPVGGLPLLTHEAGGAIAILTEGPTPLDELAAVRLHGDIVEELQALTTALDIDDARSHEPRF